MTQQSNCGSIISTNTWKISHSHELGPWRHLTVQTLVVSEWAGLGPVTAVHPTPAAVSQGPQLDDLTVSWRNIRPQLAESSTIKSVLA